MDETMNDIVYRFENFNHNTYAYPTIGTLRINDNAITDDFARTSSITDDFARKSYVDGANNIIYNLIFELRARVETLENETQYLKTLIKEMIGTEVLPGGEISWEDLIKNENNNLKEG